MPEQILLTGGRLVDADGIRESDLLIREGRIAAPGDVASKGVTAVDVSGCIVTPGFVDLHTHLREPGREDAETVASGSRAGARGGYTALCPMANTDPVADSAAVVELVTKLGERAGLVDVFPVGAITVGLQGERLAEIGEMAKSGAAVNFFSDDGKCVNDSGLMRRAMEYARTFDAIIATTPKTGPCTAADTCTRATCPHDSASEVSPRKPRRSSSPATSRWRGSRVVVCMCPMFRPLARWI
jgi:dihydroorotase